MSTPTVGSLRRRIERLEREQRQENPEMVSDDGEVHEAVDSLDLVSMSIEEFAERKVRIADLERENEELRREIEDLKARVEELEIDAGLEDRDESRLVIHLPTGKYIIDGAIPEGVGIRGTGWGGKTTIKRASTDGDEREEVER